MGTILANSLLALSTFQWICVIALIVVLVIYFVWKANAGIPRKGRRRPLRLEVGVVIEPCQGAAFALGVLPAVPFTQFH